MSAWGLAPAGLLILMSPCLGRCFFWIGIVWTGISGTLAACAYSRRELARVQV